jgi:hypothetical protein
MQGTLGSAPKPSSLRVWLAGMRTSAKKLWAMHRCGVWMFPGFCGKLHITGYYAVLAQMRDLVEFL